ncbi:MAG: hypothetical protein GC137_08580 [Alphaproteobacteria bacterium]|nr:hypothetical protein [Alphaproteobacteria bacterium]
MTPANAQDCNPPFETITRLYHPNPGSYTVWNAPYGNATTEESFYKAFPVGENIVAVGDTRNIAGEIKKLNFVEYNRRGRVFRQKDHQISGLHDFVKAYKDGENFIVLANRKTGEGRIFPWLGFFDKDYNLTAQKAIDGKNDLIGKDFIAKVDSDGWVVALTSEQNLGGDEDKVIEKKPYLYFLDKKGNVQFKRAYIVGQQNEIIGISSANFGSLSKGYIATGYIVNEHRKYISWAMRIDNDGGLLWQQQYSRGLSSSLNIPIGYHEQFILAVGDVVPADSGPKGAWLALLDANNGNVLWQRYYNGETGHHNYEGKALYESKDGLLTLMMMARSTLKPTVGEIQEDGETAFDTSIPEDMNFAHILTLSPRGITLSGDSYFFGKGVLIHGLTEGEKGERIMAGSTVMQAMTMSGQKKLHEKVEAPLREKGFVNLPDADLSDKAKRGLALLNKKLEKAALESVNMEKEESANPEGLTTNAWIGVGEAPDAYIDPCK